MNPLLVHPQARAKPTKGTLYLYDAIGEDGMGGGITAIQVVEALKELKTAGNRELEVRISSPGGSVFDGLAMFRAISEWDGPKTAILDGLCASAATVVMLACDRVNAGSETLLMVHEAWAGLFAAGTADEIVAAAEALAAPLRKANDSIVAIYGQRTGRDEDSIRKMMKAETWMTGTEAKAAGFVSEVLQDERATVGAVTDSAAAIIAKFKNAPEPVKALGKSSVAARMEARLVFDRVSRAIAARGVVPGDPGSRSVVTKRNEKE